MPIISIISGDGPCPGSQPLRATVTITVLESGPNAGCAEVVVANSPNPISTGFIGSLCLTADNAGPFTQISGPGDEGPLDGGNCPGGCLPDSDIIQSFTNTDERINPGETGTFIICSAIPFTEAQFQNVALHFQGILGCPEGSNSICLSSVFTPDVPTDGCPIANPQTCCQQLVEFNTQLVPPALANSPIETEVSFVEPPVVEDVCPEKVIICGVLSKTITYTAVSETGEQTENILTDQRQFQCVIDRDDANEGDLFDVVGYSVLCEGDPRLQNSGTRPSPSGTETVAVFWRFTEKDIIKICIRKRELPNG